MLLSIIVSALFVASPAQASEPPISCADAPVQSVSEVVTQGRDIVCQTQCKQFWIDHPEDSPKDGEHPYCRSAWEFLKSAPASVGPRCWSGLKEGFSPLQQLLGYALLVKDIGSALKRQMAEQKAFFDKAQKDSEFRTGLVRMLSQYSARNPDGSYVVRDLPPNLVNGDLPMLALMLQKDGSSRERSCSIQLAELSKTWENSGLDGNALATRRYQTIASRSPECIGTLGIPIPPDASDAPDPRTSTLQCLTSGKIEESICEQAARFASDPLARLPVTILIGRGVRLLRQTPELAVKTSHLLAPTVGISDRLKSGHTFAKILLTPYKPLAANASKSIRVVGSNFTSTEVGSELLGKLDDFNQSVTSMGFKTPTSTRVIVADKPLLPSIGGPYTVHAKVLNARDLAMPDSTIVMNPIGYQTSVTKSPTALLHEQTHAVFRTQYKPSAYINKDSTVQEALSDFMAAHQENNPVIGENALKNSPGLRDIRTQREYAKGGSSDKVSPENFSANSNHTNSIPFSNLLWQVRAKIGTEKMSSLMKPIVDDLNRNYASAGIEAGTTGAKYEQANFQYFAASLRKTLMSNGVDVPAISHLDVANPDSMSLFYLNRKDTITLSDRLKAAGDFDRTATDPVESTLLVHASAAGAAVVEGSLIYEAGRTAGAADGR